MYITAHIYWMFVGVENIWFKPFCQDNDVPTPQSSGLHQISAVGSLSIEVYGQLRNNTAVWWACGRDNFQLNGPKSAASLCVFGTETELLVWRVWAQFARWLSSNPKLGDHLGVSSCLSVMLCVPLLWGQKTKNMEIHSHLCHVCYLM